MRGAVSIALVGVLVLLPVVFAGALQSGLVPQSVANDCNDEFGEGNWVTVPANASEVPVFVVLKDVCVSVDDPRADDCDESMMRTDACARVEER